MTEAETRIARTFRARDWMPLTPAFIRIMPFVGDRVDLARACINQDLREGRLRAALVAPDGTIKMRLEASDWQRRTVHAPHIPAEGVGVEPYEEGRFFIWRADLDKEYPTNPATPAAAADRWLYAAGEPEPSQSLQAEQQLPPVAPDMDVPAPVTSATLPPAEGSPSLAREAAVAPTSNAEVGPEDQPKRTEPDKPLQADPTPSSAPNKRSRKKAVYQSSQTVRARAVLDRIFPDKDYPTKGLIPWPELLDMFSAEYELYVKDNSSKLYAKTSPTKKLSMPSERTIRRALGWE